MPASFPSRFAAAFPAPRGRMIALCLACWLAVPTAGRAADVFLQLSLIHI